jgi:hypothetical protein
MLLMVWATLLLLLMLWRMSRPPAAVAAAAACLTLLGPCITIFTVNIATAGVRLLQQQYKGTPHMHVEHTAQMVHDHTHELSEPLHTRPEASSTGTPCGASRWWECC